MLFNNNKHNKHSNSITLVILLFISSFNSKLLNYQQLIFSDSFFFIYNHALTSNLINFNNILLQIN
jgi:hypothetical protein